MNKLPLDIICLIASKSIDTWRSMIHIPVFGKFLLTEKGKEYSRRVIISFTIVEKDDHVTRYLLNGRFHREDGPAVINEYREIW